MLDESRPGSDPSSELHRVPAPWITPKPGSALIDLPTFAISKKSMEGKNSICICICISISGAHLVRRLAHFVRRLADGLRTFQRFSLAPWWRSPRRGTIKRFFCASNPRLWGVSKFQRGPVCAAGAWFVLATRPGVYLERPDSKPFAFCCGMYRD